MPHCDLKVLDLLQGPGGVSRGKLPHMHFGFLISSGDEKPHPAPALPCSGRMRRELQQVSRGSGRQPGLPCGEDPKALYMGVSMNVVVSVQGAACLRSVGKGNSVFILLFGSERAFRDPDILDVRRIF